MSNQPYTLDAMAFYKLWKERSDQGAPSYTLDSITNFAQPGKVVYEPILPPPEAFVEGRYDTYYKADMELSERGAAFVAANPNASFIETLIYLINGATPMTKQAFQSPKPVDTIDLSDKFRITLIPNSSEIPAAHVASITTIEELDEDRTEVVNTFPIQAAFTVDQMKDGQWTQLQEADFTESMYSELKPLIEAEHKRGCEAHGDAFDQRMIPEYVHVPIIGHRKHAAALFADIGRKTTQMVDEATLASKAQIFTDTPLEQTEYKEKPAE